jgi:carbamoylphosphate synthase large subunit
MDYQEILDNVGITSIIKPTNSSSSRGAFKITSREDFENIQENKLSRNFEYLIEEYIA